MVPTTSGLKVVHLGVSTLSENQSKVLLMFGVLQAVRKYSHFNKPGMGPRLRLLGLEIV